MVCRVCTLLLIAASAAALRPALPATQHRRRRGAVTMMGRKFENNKVKMAKTALAYAKKARALGPPMPGAPVCARGPRS